ncbi:MAG: endo-1,4-beta-xylanase [Bacteroidetes bacterium]|nr:endo-1,4-beta-xylanase [Bacteroidota bacterium]MCL6102331.1 endo-1,4-beta-xylanase [Bacteroidota bacterium]
MQKYSKSISTLILVFAFTLNYGCTFSATKKAEEITNKPSDNELTIRQIIDKYYQKSYFYFGCTSKAEYLEAENSEAKIFLKEFSYNTPSNEFKQTSVYPEPNATWKADNYRQLLVMARENDQVVRAHCPISPQCSTWAKQDNRTAEELKSVMTYYMTNMSKELEANKDVVKWMDVVNETVVSTKLGDGTNNYLPGDWFGPLKGTDRWENPWLKIGQETDTELKVPIYIKTAFEIANKYAPSIKHLYNHNGRLEQEAWDKVKQTVLYLRSKGLRVDAIGWQAHVPVGFEKEAGTMEKLSNLIDWCYQNKLEFHITELDTKIGKDFDPKLLKEKENEIADTYGAIVETMLKKVGKGAVAINCWTLKDRVRKGEGYFAGLFDSELNPTPAYFRVKELLLKYAPKNK